MTSCKSYSKNLGVHDMVSFWPEHPGAFDKHKFANRKRGRAMFVKGFSPALKRKFLAHCCERGVTMTKLLCDELEKYRRGEKKLEFSPRRERWGTSMGGESIYFSLPPDLKCWLKAYCARHGWYFYALIRYTVEKIVSRKAGRDWARKEVQKKRDK